jgi:hypothetical protein
MSRKVFRIPLFFASRGPHSSPSYCSRPHLLTVQSRRWAQFLLYHTVVYVVHSCSIRIGINTDKKPSLGWRALIKGAIFFSFQEETAQLTQPTSQPANNHQSTSNNAVQYVYYLSRYCYCYCMVYVSKVLKYEG